MKKRAELGKPSLFNPSAMFAEVTIAVVDPDAHISLVVKKILAVLGCKRIYMVANGQECLQLMREDQVDLVITEWDMPLMDGIELTTFLRQSLDSPNRMVPIIMLTGNCDGARVRKARDMGITEFVIKPFSAKSLLERVYDVVENPRGFILCKNYIGPDRRRANSFSAFLETSSDRPMIKRKPPLVVPKESLTQLIIDDTPRMIMPDFSLKKKIGLVVPAETMISEETLKQSTEMLSGEYDRFHELMQKDVQMLEQCFVKLRHEPEDTRRHIEELKHAAFDIYARAGTFGFVLAAEIAKLLHDFCKKYYDRYDPNHLVIVEKHIQTISVIFAHKVQDGDGEIGGQLIADLSRLIQKYIPSARQLREEQDKSQAGS